MRRMSYIQKIVEFIFGKTVKIQDPFFGEMLDTGDYYECRRLFGPTNSIVEIGLEKKEITPDDKQIKFFKWIENNYDFLINIIQPEIEKIVKNWDDNFEIHNFKKEISLEYLYIPNCDETTFEWNIFFMRIMTYNILAQ